MNANQVALGVENERHLADGSGHRLHLEFHIVRAQMRDGVVKVFHFEADGAAVRAQRPIRRAATERERAAGDVIFRPLHPAGFAENYCGFQSEHAFVELARPRHVLDWITTERDFSDFEHIYYLVGQVSCVRNKPISFSDWSFKAAG